MITKLISKVFGTNNARQLKSLQPIINNINALEPKISKLTDQELSNKTAEFKDQLSNGKTLDDILPEAFAVVRETSKRKLGQRHYDVQLIGGIVLHQGRIAEMKTGEGKTLTATLPLYLNALSGKGAHLVTVNDYLAKRDAEWMSPIFNFLGMTVGVLQNNMDDSDRKEAYNSDIMYATNNELGFDYLRDNMKFRKEDFVQRDLNFAIVDEVDSILIDEARTPLIISGAADQSSELYVFADKAIRSLSGSDYEVDEKDKNVLLAESGVDKLEKFFNVQNLYALDNVKLVHHITQALKAHTLFKRDVDYVVKEGEVLIVDEFTGRILSGRRYSDGLHQAIEAKENVKIEQESQTMASITLQNFFRLYNKLSGMTGTAATEAEEFHRIYNLDVVSIPTNRPLQRQDKADLIFLSKNAKYKAIVEDVKERYKNGQPVLIGTVAIEQSEILSNILTTSGIPHEVLNAKQHAREADIVAYAGHPGKITIATNMAGRGTDIKLTSESKENGGLYILGTERHESRRIDNQLRGRSGRQGDFGESRFYISLEDDLIRIFAGDTIKKNMQRVGMTEDEQIESRFISRTIERSQEKVEKHNFEIRKHLLEYDDVLNQQRSVVYKYRRSFLDKELAPELSKVLLADVIENEVYLHNISKNLVDSEVNKTLEVISELTNTKQEELARVTASAKNKEELAQDLINYLEKEYTSRIENHANKDMLLEANKWIMLETIDHAWKYHMQNLDSLKEGIGLRGWGQKNPLIEYKKEAFAMFEEMMAQVKYEIVRLIFHIKIDEFNQEAIERRRERELESLNQLGADQSEDNVQAESNKIGRNDSCPCGSGKKYKKCCGLLF